jgi:hypothetical protein
MEGILKNPGLNFFKEEVILFYTSLPLYIHQQKRAKVQL